MFYLPWGQGCWALILALIYSYNVGCTYNKISSRNRYNRKLLGDLILPRTPDPELEERVARAALRLLDAGGMPALTMRAVAKEAGTTTPTIYERFADREDLLEAVRGEAELELLGAVRRASSVTELIKGLVEFSLKHPNRLDLRADLFGSRLAAGQPMPVYHLLREQLTREVGVYGARREELAMALASLTIGTARTMIAAGIDTPAAKELQRTCMAAVQLLLKAFSTSETSRAGRRPAT
jgi:AcrR family transcriptional regulator